MTLTLNQVINRLQVLALSHKQINHFFIGGIDEFLDNGDVQYPAVFCEIKQGQISRANRQATYNFTFYFLDLLNISTGALANEWEVKSDMSSVAQDYLAMVSFYEYQDSWDISTSNNVDFHSFKLHDLCAGVSVSVGVSVRFANDRCQVPATGIVFEPVDPGGSSVPVTEGLVYNYVYTATGSEGYYITIGTLSSKTILMLFKGDKILTKVTTPTDVNEYSYNATNGRFDFGTDFETGQVLQFIYR
jgi:hypothetical protein